MLKKTMSLETDLNFDQWLKIGVITSAYGLKGQLKVTPITDFPERFTQPGERLIISPDYQQKTIVQLLSGRYVPGKTQVIIRLEGIDDRTQAEMLRGYELFVNGSDRPSLPDDEYHISQLIDLSVYLQETDQIIGKVVDVFLAGNNLLEIELTTAEFERKKVLIPFVKEIVPIVDLANQRIDINPPSGLLEL
ncbi:MAG: ribosome maturation factor RimM [Microcystaceae cyanobacterium]